jgi:hypothetical protein
MNKLAQSFLVLLLLFAAGCDGSRRIGIALSPSAAQSVDEGQSFNLTATLTNDSHNKGVTWSLNGAGTLSGQTATSVTFTAPSAVSSAARRLRAHASTGSPATITATSAAEPNVTAALQVTVNPAPTMGTPTLPDATEGTAYSQPVSAAGGSGALTYSVASGTLPAGLSLNASTGAITGTPTGPTGTSTFAIKATDASNAGALSAVSGNITIKVILPGGPSITTTSLPAGTMGVAYNQSVSASGGLAPLTYSISAGALPPGLGIGASSGAITGTPTTAGSFTFTVQVTDSSTPTAQTVTQQLTMTVNAAMAITTSSLSNGTNGTSYSAQVTESGGVAPFTWSLSSGSLPAGLGIGAGSGTISGTPTATGTSNFTVKVVDSSAPQQTATKALSITIVASNANICDPANTGSESLLNGHYAMVLQGFNDFGPLVYGAVFNADGAGHIGTQVGTLDTNSITGSNPLIDVPFTSGQSSYTLGPDHRGCLTITTSAGTLPFSFTVSSIVSGIATRAHVIETNTAKVESASGILYKQDTTAFSNAKLNGNYAFGISAPNAGQTKFAAVGVLHLDGVQNITGQWDTNSAGVLNSNGSTFPTSAIPITAGVYSVDSDGRGTLAFGPTLSSEHGAVFYVIDATTFLMMSDDLQSTTNPLFQGIATLQTGGPFSNSSMNAPSIFATSGLSATSGSTVVRIGTIQPVSPGSLIHNFDDNGSSGSAAPGITLAVDSAGRGVLQTQQLGSVAVFYLSAPNQGYLLFMRDPIDGLPQHVESGQFWAPSGLPFNDVTLGGGNWSFGSVGADSFNSNQTDGWAKFTAVTANQAITTGDTDVVTGQAFSANFNAPFSESLFLVDSAGQLLWQDSSMNELSFGFLLSSKTAIAVDSRDAQAPVLVFYEAQQ